MKIELEKLDAFRRAANDFLSGRDTSVACANRIESTLFDMGVSEGEGQDLIDVLVSYRPGGGEYLFDENALAKEIRAFMTKI